MATSGGDEKRLISYLSGSGRVSDTSPSDAMALFVTLYSDFFFFFLVPKYSEFSVQGKCDSRNGDAIRSFQITGYVH